MKFVQMLKPLSVAVALVMTGCATVSPAFKNTTNPMPTETAGTSKETLSKALTSQLRSSFSYRTDVYVSNQIRRDALDKATDEQLSALDDATQACEHAHDTAYVALLKVAKADDLLIDDKKYKEQTDKIKNDFLACQIERRKTQEFDVDDLYQEFDGEDDEVLAQKLDEKLTDWLSSNQSDNGNYTALDAKKAKLLDAYLLKPSQISVVGRYEPLKGFASALPMFDYSSKNLTLSINQPIYVDLKAGGIYLWADNFALANSQTLDKQLGDKWKDKWLFVPFNDGSLPDDFAKNFIKAYVDAKKESFIVQPESSFVAVSPKDLHALPFWTTNLPKHQQDIINNTPTIIQNALTASELAYKNYVFADRLYNSLSDAYPELTAPEPTFDEREIVDGESVIHVVSADASADEEEQTLQINSRFMMTAFLAYLQNNVEAYYANLSAEQGETSETSETNEADEPSPYTPSTYYGIKNGKISWLSHRHYPTQSLATGQLAKSTLSESEPLIVDAFTQISQNVKDMGEFSRLPTAVQTPNATNSINVFEYKDDLLERLKSGDDKYLKMLSDLVLGTTAEAEAEAWEEDDVSEESSEVETADDGTDLETDLDTHDVDEADEADDDYDAWGDYEDEPNFISE